MVCDMVVPSNFKDGTEMSLLDSSAETLNVMTVQGPVLTSIVH